MSATKSLIFMLILFLVAGGAALAADFRREPGCHAC